MWSHAFSALLTLIHIPSEPTSQWSEVTVQSSEVLENSCLDGSIVQSEVLFETSTFVIQTIGPLNVGARYMVDGLHDSVYFYGEGHNISAEIDGPLSIKFEDLQRCSGRDITIGAAFQIVEFRAEEYVVMPQQYRIEESERYECSGCLQVNRILAAEGLTFARALLVPREDFYIAIAAIRE